MDETTGTLLTDAFKYQIIINRNAVILDEGNMVAWSHTIIIAVE